MDVSEGRWAVAIEAKAAMAETANVDFMVIVVFLGSDVDLERTWESSQRKRTGKREVRRSNKHPATFLFPTSLSGTLHIVGRRSHSPAAECSAIIAIICHAECATRVRNVVVAAEDEVLAGSSSWHFGQSDCIHISHPSFVASKRNDDHEARLPWFPASQCGNQSIEYIQLARCAGVR